LTSHLIQRHSVLTAWVREAPVAIEARALDDVRSFMSGFLADQAVTVPAHKLRYEFAFADPAAEMPDGAFGLKNLTLLGAAIVDGKVRSAGGEAVVQKVPMLLCSVVPEEKREGSFWKCPLYRTAFVVELNRNDEETEVREGESGNFVWEVELPVDQPVEEFILNGAALFCSVPDPLM
jgi:hypothetical protein